MASIADPNGRLVLVVDDEPMILRAIAVALTRAGFRVIVAENGAAGLETFLVEPDLIDVVLTDMVMPLMDGHAMVQEIRKVRPTIPVLFMSAYPQKVMNAIHGPMFPLIRKPFPMADLIRAMTEILDYRPSVADQPRHSRGSQAR
jgi:two-component system cell cycle sensor histidine kinase/response regulator CckA